MSVPSFTSFPTFDAEPPKRELKKDEKSNKRGRKEEKDHKSRSSTRRKETDRHEPRDTSRERTKERDGEDYRKRDKGKDRHREKDRHHRRPDEAKHRSHSKRDGQSPSIIDDSYRLFFSDRKPDHLNIQYGGLHAGDVPRYHSVHGGRYAIGLPRGLVLHRVGKGIEVCIKSRNSKLSGISDPRTRSLLSLPPNRRLVGSQDDSKYQEIDGCIRFPSRRPKTSPEDTYRSIVEVKDEDGSDDDSNSSGDGSNDDLTDDEGSKLPETSQQAQLRTLEQELAKNKSSAETWLALLDVTLSTIPITSKNATKARCDITVSVLQRAIDSHPSASASPILRIKYLKAGEDIWDPDQLASRWNEALSLGDVALWMEWLEWRIRQSKLGLEGLFEDMDRVLSADPFQQDNVESELARLRVFWRTATAVKGAGFTERAMAMFQAQLEFAFNLPLQLSSSPMHEQLDELEEFWDSESLRMLEDGAKGWKDWYRSGKLEFHSKGPSPSPNPDVRDLDPYRQWAFHEAAVDRVALFPTRATEETEEVDPYAAVLFSDIRSSLVKISSPHAKHALRLAALSFLGFPLSGTAGIFSSTSTNTNWDDRWTMGAFTDPNHLSAIVPGAADRREVLGESIAGSVIAHEKEYRDSFGPVKNWGHDTLSPLDIRAHTAKSQQHLWTSSDIEGVDVKLALRAFAQLRQHDSDFEWDSLALAYEAALNIRNALKLSKAFLATPKESLEYWGAHAQLERLNGRPDGARKIYQTVLMASAPKPFQRGLSSLWWNWAEMEWLAGADEQAVNVILQCVGVQATTGVSILRAKRSFDDLVAGASRWQDRQNWTKLRALLELLNGADMKDVLVIFDAELHALSRGTVPHESLAMAALLFVFNHRVVLKNPMPPALLRERAEQALEGYPSNSIILGVFLEGEKGQGVWGKVRGMLGASDGKVKDVARRLEEVWLAGWEKGRWLAEAERTRSGLAAAVEHERTRASPVIWRVYLEFEIKTGKYHNAKKLLFRAIGECPLSKELYLLAFGPLRSVFDGKELQSLADLMVERGIRLRQALDDAVDSAEDKYKMVEDNGDEDMDEIEHNAQELRRLMPY